MKRMPIFFFLIFFAFLSCKKKDEPIDIPMNYRFQFYLRDKNTNQNLVGYNGEPYKPNFLKIYQIYTHTYPTYQPNMTPNIDSNGEYILKNVLLIPQSYYNTSNPYSYAMMLRYEDNTNPPLVIDTIKMYLENKTSMRFYQGNQELLYYDFLSPDIPTLTLKK